MKKISESRIVHALVALLVSVGFWCYVVIGSNPTYTSNLTVTNVYNEGLSELTGKGYYFIGELPEKIEIRATGARSLVTKGSDDYSAKIDFTTIQGAGEYNLRVRVETPDGVAVKSVKPEFVKVTIDAGARDTVDVKLNVQGGKIAEFEIPSEVEPITVSGPKSMIDEIAYFKLKINTDTIAKTGQLNYKAIPCDEEDKEVVNEKLTFDNNVTVDIRRIKKVDVVVDESRIPDYIKEHYNVTVTVSEPKVKIAGEDSVLAENDKILADISTVQLAPSLGSQKERVKLIPPEGTALAKDSEKTVEVIIEYEPIDRR